MIKLNYKVILFGFIFTFFSSFGQSFFIGLFNSSVREDLNISHGQFGSVYASATLLSSVALVWFGKKIDELKLLNFSFIVIFFLFISSLFFSFVNSIYLLFLGIFLLRFSGQGLMSHTASTVISRYFEKSRGKALSMIWFGLSCGEFLLPVTIVYLFSLFYWRNIWTGIAVVIILFLPLVAFFTIRNLQPSSREKNNNLPNNQSFNIKNWQRKEILTDYRFYIISLTMLAMPCIATGVFVYQSFIAESKNWGAFVIAKSFMAYSIMSVMTLVISGFLIDKYTSRKFLPLMNLPLLASLIVLSFFKNPISSYFFLGLLGISNGLANVLGSSTWAEIYGVRYIGGIRALTTAMMVFSTAFGTAIFGFFIDNGFSIEKIGIGCSFYVIISTMLIFLFRNTFEPRVIKT
jgi:predicted MFS family arabinose efflux permease